jgi:O-antigen chain-terminating methyltransferase
VLIDESGAFRLIDYGSVADRACDVVWPFDIHLAFLLFVREVLAGTLPRTYPSRPPLLSPGNFPGQWRQWVSKSLALPVSDRSFAQLRKTLDEPSIGQGTGEAEPTIAASTWEEAIERNLDLLGEQLGHIRRWIELDWHSARDRGESQTVAAPGSRPLPDLFAQLDALGTAIGESRSELRTTTEAVALESRTRHRLEQITTEMQERAQQLEADLRSLELDLVPARRASKAFEALANRLRGVIRRKRRRS